MQSAVLRSHVVCLSVCNVGGLRSHRFEYIRNNFTISYLLVLVLDVDELSSRSFHAPISDQNSRTGPGPLVDDQGNTSILPSEMAEKFNSYFVSVFTMENTSNIPTADLIFSGSETDKLMEFTIDESVVRKKLDKLRVDKAAGADDLSPRIPIEIKAEGTMPRITDQYH